eukprot:TRINITY_DN5315_c0_g1_i2.p1 TRINITY_DN5315_c0_g1~~TRINITY_DN5315_c0_g1_i2.p1  ORF type:complete len:309 (-),score=38.85 TRINITY_DN5315_c0_g1_i2:22-948(-)
MQRLEGGVLQIIFANVKEGKDLVCACLVCKSWHKIAKQFFERFAESVIIARFYPEQILVEMRRLLKERKNGTKEIVYHTGTPGSYTCNEAFLSIILYGAAQSGKKWLSGRAMHFCEIDKTLTEEQTKLFSDDVDDMAYWHDLRVPEGPEPAGDSDKPKNYLVGGHMYLFTFDKDPLERILIRIPHCTVCIYAIDLTKTVDTALLEEAVRLWRTHCAIEWYHNFFLIGTKADLKDARVIKREQLWKFARKYECAYIDTSATTAHGINELFCEAARLTHYITFSKLKSRPPQYCTKDQQSRRTNRKCLIQ